MVKYIKICFIILFFSNCGTGTFESIFPNDRIIFQTDKTEYFRYENINLRIENKTHSSFEIGLSCSTMLIMNYQIFNNNEWSKNQRFRYTSRRCPTIPVIFKDINKDSIYNYILDPVQINGLDTFRLVLHINFNNELKIDSVFSNQFQILIQ